MNDTGTELVIRWKTKMSEVSKIPMPSLHLSISRWTRICLLAVVVMYPALRANAGVMVFTFDFSGASH